ncbi:MAG: hypothetical protein K0R65_842 [Crocinitomicaceae bacterium]|jgi:Na+-transporting methylmalonyl-CoA/oxaloacetate decarboxylase gamma subunit|nr:hypothetical protein [Crocinitomicaceae bacterium]
MKKVFVVLSLMMFVGSMTSTAIAATNGVSVEIKKDDKKKKKKAKKGSCCATTATTKSCCSKEKKSCTEKK